MFDIAQSLFLYLESPLHVGSGEEGGVIDLPLQREPATGYPLLPASSLKGALRACARRQRATDDLIRLLGSPPESDVKQPSAVVLSDALPLLFPVRSLTGLFAWVTGPDVIQRFHRDLSAYGVALDRLPSLANLPAGTAGVTPGSPLLTSKQTLVLEELSFPTKQATEVVALGFWLAENAIPEGPAFDYWRQRVAHSIVVLPEDSYRYFLEHSTQVAPRIRIDPRTGTAADGALWTEEYLPPETVLYAMAGVKMGEAPEGLFKSADDALGWVKGLAPAHLQVGGGQTLGRGLVRLRWAGKKAAPPAPPPAVAASAKGRKGK